MKLLLIGAGGIGSFFARTLHKAIRADQFRPELEVHVYDDDAVELKNIKYQDYEFDDIGFDKSEALSIRCDFTGHLARVTPEVLTGSEYDIIVCAVDNADTRRELFAYWLKTGVYFVDLRAEGRTISFFTPGEGKLPRTTRYEELLETLRGASTESGSCQRAVELNAGIIQLGNQIIAPIGMQLVLNYTRGVANPSSYIHRF